MAEVAFTCVTATVTATHRVLQLPVNARLRASMRKIVVVANLAGFS
jgi:hypothetical protein